MIRRRSAIVALLLAAVLVVSGCGGTAPHKHAGTLDGSTVPVKRDDRRCDGVSYRDVLGHAPSYGAAALRRFPASSLACKAMWLPHLGRWFVPQSLALDGHTAWVSGYTWHENVGDRACRLLHVRLRTGEVLADQGRLVGAPEGRTPTFCRHGGGLAMNWRGLWIAEKERLWLVDPAKVGTGQRAVLRVWSIKSPVFGSTTVIRHRRIGLAFFRRQHDSGIKWFRIRDLMADGVLDLVGVATDPSQVAPVARARVPGYIQGMTYRPGHRGLMVAASRRGCGVLILADGTTIDVMPGIEDFEFTGHNRVWAISESSSKVYQRTDGPMVPMLTKFNARKLLALPTGGRCRR
ncbi:MAG: hypothetical protein QOH37_1195 [Nocardioidaceae bacterium]|nr:hypothetical protein [Nocardioidaceae bacterium]